MIVGTMDYFSRVLRQCREMFELLKLSVLRNRYAYSTILLVVFERGL